MKTTIELMSHTWANGGGGKVWLASNDNQWKENCHDWSEYGSILKYISNQPQGADLYWTPLVFVNNESRKAINAKQNQGVLYVDMDRTDISYENCFQLIPEPSFIWTTSNNRWQAIWLLEDTIRISTQQEVNRRLAYHLKADTGAWDAARVLRVPGSINYKRGGEVGGIVKYEPDVVFNIDDFDPLPNVMKADNNFNSDSGGMPAVPLYNDWQLYIKKEWDNIPLEARYWITITDQQYKSHGVIDRSNLVYTLIKKLSIHYSPQEVFILLWHAPFNKFLNRPLTLWQQIEKLNLKLQTT